MYSKRHKNHTSVLTPRDVTCLCHKQGKHLMTNLRLVTWYDLNSIAITPFPAQSLKWVCRVIPLVILQQTWYQCQVSPSKSIFSVTSITPSCRWNWFKGDDPALELASIAILCFNLVTLAICKKVCLNLKSARSHNSLNQ